MCFLKKIYKMFKFRKVCLVAAVLFSPLCSFVQGSNVLDQVENDSVLKGRFVEREDVFVNVSSESVINEWSAEDIFGKWDVDGFSLKGKAGEQFLTSGVYPSGAMFSAESEKVLLPKVGRGEVLFVQLDHDVDVEFHYDEVAVYLLTDGGKSKHKVYAFSGKLKENVPSSFDLTEFAGKEVEIRLELTADETIAGKGWNLRALTLLSGSNPRYVQERGQLQALRSGGTELKLNIDNIQVGDDGTGEADFYLDDPALFEEYKKRQDELFIMVNGQPAGCLNFLKTGEIDEVNIVYAIDNSGSMGEFQKEVATSVRELIRYSTTLFDSYAVLLRFGQDGRGCSVIESDPYGNNIFDLSTDEGLDGFSEGRNAVWLRNVQSGSTEQYYAVLKKLADTPFQKVFGKQTVVVLMGDESLTDGRNSGDCDGGTSGFSLADQAGLADYLAERGVKVFVIQRSSNKAEYQTIVNRTGGAFIDITSDYKVIADKIFAKLRNHFKVEFCTQNSYECGQSVLVNADWGGASEEKEVTVNGTVSVKRDEATELLGDVPPMQPVTLTFDVEADANCLKVESGVVRYVYNDSVAVSIPVKVIDGKVSVTLPAEHIVGEKILYRVLLDVEDKGTQVGNPYVTHSSWAWELGIRNDRPEFSDANIDERLSCRDRNFSITITDNDGVGSATLYYKTSKSAAFESVDLMQNPDGTFGSSLEKNVGRGQGFYYYVTATDNRDLEANYGEASAPMFMEFENPVADGSVSRNEIKFKNSRPNNCKPLDSGKKGTLFFYVKNDCDDLVLIEKTEIVGDVRNNYPISLPMAQDGEDKIGAKEGEQVYIHFMYGDGNVEYDVADFEFDPYAELSICVPEEIDSLTLIKSEITSVRSSGAGTMVNFGDTIDFGKVSDAVAVKFSVPNDHYAPVVLNGVKIIGGESCFALDEDLKNLVVEPDETGSFRIIYTPNGGALAEVRIYNNTRKQNPFVFYVKGEADNSVLCKSLCPSVTVYDNSFVAQVRVESSLSEVTVAVKDMDGNLLVSSVQEMGGPAVQSIGLSTQGMNPNKEYELYVQVDSFVCENAFVFNEKSVENFDSTAVENCTELVRNLSVNSWGTMIDVPVFESAEMVEIAVYTMGGQKTEVAFGPQLMGGPTTHSLYLGTGALPSGTYVVKVRVGDKSCSRSFVNVK